MEKVFQTGVIVEFNSECGKGIQKRVTQERKFMKVKEMNEVKK